MSLTNWLFGSLKRKNAEEKPIDTEVYEVGSDDGYSIIQAPSPGLYPQIPSSVVSSLPYSVVSPANQQSQYQTSPERFGRTTSVHSQIDGVPFLLAPYLETYQTKSLSELDNFKHCIEQVQLDIRNNIYNYNFKLERNIIQESIAFNRIRTD